MLSPTLGVCINTDALCMTVIAVNSLVILYTVQAEVFA